MYNAIGMVELSSIARGIYTADQMIKTAAVEAVSCTAVCPGKYIVLIQGDVAAVESSVDAGIQSAGEYIDDHLLFPMFIPAYSRLFLLLLCRNNGRPWESSSRFLWRP